jgi:tetratricopeptide (TPR) repeat protein
MEAEAELKLLLDTTGAIPTDAPLGNSTARGVLAIAEHLLAGKIAQARGDQKAAIELLGKSVAAEDAVNYNEPPDWDLPVREWLGGTLIAAGNHAEAEKVFRAELRKHPSNGRALFGLLESLKRQGRRLQPARLSASSTKPGSKRIHGFPPEIRPDQFVKDLEDFIKDSEKR